MKEKPCNDRVVIKHKKVSVQIFCTDVFMFYLLLISGNFKERIVCVTILNGTIVKVGLHLFDIFIKICSRGNVQLFL